MVTHVSGEDKRVEEVHFAGEAVKPATRGR